MCDVYKYFRSYTEGVQSGIILAVMTHSGGIPQTPRQNSPNEAAWGTTHSRDYTLWECGCGVCMHSHLGLQQSRLSNSLDVEWLISTADEVVEIKEVRGHTGDLRIQDKRNS